VTTSPTFHEIPDALPDAVVVYDRETFAIEEVNARGCALLGRTRDEILSGKATLLTPEDGDYTAARAREILRAAAAGQPQTFEWPLAGPTGRTVWVEITLRCAVLAGKERLLALAHDITTRRRTEERLRENAQALRETRAFLWKAQEVGRLGTWIAGLGDGTLNWSKEVYEIYGVREPFDLRVETFLGLVHADDRERVRSVLARAISDRQPYAIDHRIVRQDGVVRWVHERAEILEDEEKRPVQLVGVVQDVTGRKRTEEDLRTLAARLERSNRELEDFATVASHDLQEPLRKVLVFGDRLRAKFGGALGDEGRDYLERMQDASRRMQKLIEDLLMLSRVTTSGQPFTFVPLGDLARSVVSDLEVTLEASRGRVEIEELPTIEADPIQMHQLFQNLISNGLKFRRPDVPPVVRVFAELSTRHGPQDGTGRCRILVEDNGTGFDDKDRDQLFKVFRRLHDQREYPGTGVGLAICRRIAERHGGDITARGQPGRGATFVVTLPLSQPRGGTPS
jgi:PAS domain S-box-containing protein